MLSLLWFTASDYLSSNLLFTFNNIILRENLEDTKGVIEGQTLQWSKEKEQKGQAMTYKTWHRKLRNEQNEP